MYKKTYVFSFKQRKEIAKKWVIQKRKTIGYTKKPKKFDQTSAANTLAALMCRWRCQQLRMSYMRLTVIISSQPSILMSKYQ